MLGKLKQRWFGSDRATGLESPGTGVPRPLPALEFEPESPEFIRDPYPCYARLRREAPLHRSRDGVWVLTRHADVVDALSDRRLSNTPAPYSALNARNRDRYACADVANNTLPFLSGFDHQRLRQIVAPAFHGLLRQRPVPLEVYARELLEPHRRRGELELMQGFATPFTLKVLCRLLGFPEQDGPRLKQWSDYFFYLFTLIPSEEMRGKIDQALTEFRDYVGRAVATRVGRPPEDLIGHLLLQRVLGGEFTDQELVDNCMLIFADGIGNVDSGIANLVASLTSQAGLFDSLRSESALIPSAVDECLRHETPGQWIARVAVEEIQWHDQTIRPGEAVLLVLGSANRDETVFPSPDRVDLRRDNVQQHLAFGRGAHACLGGHLVRMQMQAALQVMLEDLPDLRRNQPELRWRPRTAHRWLESLHVRFTVGT